LDKEHNIALLDRYIRNECSEKEIIEIKSRLDSDPDFANDYQILKDLEGGTRLDNLNVKMHVLQDLEKKITDSEIGRVDTSTASINPVPKQPKVRKLSFLRYAVAAIGLFLVGVTGYNLMNKDNLYDIPNFDQYVLHETSRSTDTATLSKEQQRAYNIYIIQDFDDAIPMLKKLWEKNEDELAGYYLGVSLWMTGKEDQARAILDKPIFNTYKKPY